MLSAPEAFMAVANATAAIVQRVPPRIAYRVTGTVHFARGESPFARSVVVRTADGSATIRDEATGRTADGPPFPASPAFDALAHWQLRGDWTARGGDGTARDVTLRIVNVEPLRFAAAASRADAVARAVRGYRVSFGEPEGRETHLVLAPTGDYFGDGRRTAWISDVWYDGATLIPSRVRIAGRDGFALDARYAIVDGVWLLRALRVAQTFRALAGLVRESGWLEAAFDDYRFPPASADAGAGRIGA